MDSSKITLLSELNGLFNHVVFNLFNHVVFRSGENTTQMFKSASLAFIKLDGFSDFFKEI